MEGLLSVALGILAAIGGFVDIGDIVFNVQAGSMFGYQLLWVGVVGVGGIMTYAEMCGRVAAVSERAVFDAVRERLGFGVGVVALVAASASIVPNSLSAGTRCSAMFAAGPSGPMTRPDTFDTGTGLSCRSTPVRSSPLPTVISSAFAIDGEPG